MKRVAVIGATSPLGLTLVPALKGAGYRVAASFRSEQLVPEAWHGDAGIDLVHLDLKSADPMPTLRCEAVVWLAHLDAGRFNNAEPETNLRAFERFLGTVEKTGVDKFVFISSGGSVYGHAKTLPISEGHERDPLSSYGITKKQLEDRLTRFGEATGTATAILRPGNIYGFEMPDQKTKGVIAAFLNALKSGGPFTLIHGGRTVRDLIHVDDVCSAIDLAINAEERQVIWNVGTGRGTEVIDVLKTILRKTGRRMPRTEDRENFASDVLASVLSPARISGATDWNAQIELDEGIDRTLQHWKLLSRSSEAVN